MNTIVLMIFFATGLLSWWLVGKLIIFLKKHQIVDVENERSSHHGSVPRGGGLVIVGILIFIILAMSLISNRSEVFIGLGILLTAWGALSWWDDRNDLSARKRLVFQMFIAISTLFAFGYITSLQISNVLFINLPYVGVVITFVGVLWMANLYNFMDGIDGLAASQTIIASITLAFWFWQAGDQHFAFLCLLLSAASYGFLIWNWQPAKIFLGDVGSITLGAFFATLIIFANTRYQIPVISFVLLFSVFVLDATTTILIRLFKGEKVWLPHRSHYYQRITNSGVHHRSVVIVQIILMLLCSIIASLTVLDHDRIGLSVGLIFLLFFISVAIVKYIERKYLV